jgi:hypothetical protein
MAQSESGFSKVGNPHLNAVQTLCDPEVSPWSEDSCGSYHKLGGVQKGSFVVLLRQLVSDSSVK